MIGFYGAEPTNEILSTVVGFFLLFVIECGAYYTINMPGNIQGIPLLAIRMNCIGDTLSRVVGFAFIDAYGGVQDEVIRTGKYAHLEATGLGTEYPIEQVTLIFFASLLLLLGFLRLCRKAMLLCLERRYGPDQSPQPVEYSAIEGTG